MHIVVTMVLGLSNFIKFACTRRVLLKIQNPARRIQVDFSKMRRKMVNSCKSLTICIVVNSQEFLFSYRLPSELNVGQIWRTSRMNSSTVLLLSDVLLLYSVPPSHKVYWVMSVWIKPNHIDFGHILVKIFKKRWNLTFPFLVIHVVRWRNRSEHIYNRSCLLWISDVLPFLAYRSFSWPFSRPWFLANWLTALD